MKDFPYSGIGLCVGVLLPFWLMCFTLSRFPQDTLHWYHLPIVITGLCLCFWGGVFGELAGDRFALWNENRKKEAKST